MRKFFTFVTFIALLTLAALPSMAQDSNTIADIVVASTEAETPEFTTLLTAVGAADPAVLELISDPEAEITIFAPTDAAFAELAEALGEEEFTAILENEALLTAILQYHVVPGVVMSGDVVAGLEASEEGAFMVDSAQGIRFEVAQEDADSPITVAGAELNLDMLDIEADNGVIHVVNSVMVPPLDTIADVVIASTEAEEPEFTTLLAAVAAADPAILELLSDPLAGVTVFAPTDAAFAALGEETLNAVIADQAALTGILQYHVTSGVFYSDEVVELVADGAVEIEMADGNLAEVTPELTIAGANIVMTDIETLNGVVHVIDAVILPPTE